MNIGIVGAGGVGGLLAGFLLADGHQVYLSARGEHAKAILQNGLTVETRGRTIHQKPTAILTDNLSQFSNCQIVLLTVKMYDLEKTCQDLKKVLNPEATLVTLQNGIEATDIVAKYFGKENVAGGSIITSSRIESPGLIIHYGANLKVTFENKNTIVKNLSDALNKSGVTCELTDSIESILWNKLIRLASVSGVTCLTRQPFGWIKANIDASNFLRELISEAYAVALSCGVELPRNTVEESYEGINSSCTDDFKPSMLLDLERGKKLEVNYLSGALSKMGKGKNVPTPFHEAVAVALAPFANGKD